MYNVGDVVAVLNRGKLRDFGTVLKVDDSYDKHIYQVEFVDSDSCGYFSEKDLRHLTEEEAEDLTPN